MIWVSPSKSVQMTFSKIVLYKANGTGDSDN